MIQKKNVRIIVLAFAMLLILPMVAFTNVSAHSRDVIASGWTPYPPKIDAVLENGEWAGASITKITINTTKPELIDVTIYVMNDRKYLYLAFEVYDGIAEEDDGITVYFDEKHDGTLTNGDEDVRSIRADGGIKDYHWRGDWVYDLQENFEAKMGRTGNSWVMECQILLDSPDPEDLNVLEPGEVLGFMMLYWDHSRWYGAWPDESSQIWTSPSRWADIVLSAEGISPKLEVISLFVHPSPAVVDRYFVAVCTIKNAGTAKALNVTASFSHPTGLTLAPGQSSSVNMGSFDPNYTETVTWSLKSSLEGSYTLTVTISGTNVDENSSSVDVKVAADPKYKELEELKLEYDKLKAYYDKLKSDYDSLKASYDQLKSDYEKILADYGGLKAEYDKLAMDYKVLKSDYDKLKADYNSLKDSYDKLKIDHDSLKVTYDKLKTDYDLLKATYDKLTNDYKDLQTKYSSLKGDYDKLTSDYSELKLEYESTIGKLSTNTNLLYIFITTTIAFIATTVYFARRKPK